MTDTHSPSAAFLREVHDFVSETGMSESKLGRRAVGDSGSLARLRDGKSITLRTADKIIAYMAAERARRAEAGARRSTAYLSEAEDCEAALEVVPPWRVRFLRWFGR